MKSLMHNQALRGAALALLLTVPAFAGTDQYKFETAGPPSGITLTVRLVDETTGEPVRNAHLFAIHRQWLPVKGVPRFIDRRIALTADDSGRFTYESNDVQTGVTIRLVARIGDSDSDISGSVRVGS